MYLTRTGGQWRSLPRHFGAPSTVHARFQEWTVAGVFQRLWARALLEYDAKTGPRWAWQSMDGTMTKAPLGGERTGPNPTDRGKLGVKRSLLTDGRGIPLAVVVAPANRNDRKLVEATLDARPMRPPRGVRQRLCLDKGWCNTSGLRERLGSRDSVPWAPITLQNRLAGTRSSPGTGSGNVLAGDPCP